MRTLLAKLRCLFRGHTQDSLHRIGYGGSYVTRCRCCGTVFHLLRLLALLAVADATLRAAPINVTWTPYTWASYYAVDFTGPGGGRLLVTNLNAVSFTNAQPGVQYTVTVRAATNWVEAGVTNSQMSDPAVPIHVVAPDPPTGLKVGALFQEAEELPGPWTTNQILVQNVGPPGRSRFYRVSMGFIGR